MAELLEQINGEPGYVVCSMSLDEINIIRELIREQYLTRIMSIDPEHSTEFFSRSITDYHEVANLIDHQTMWPKRARILGPRAVAEITSLTFYKKLSEQLGVVQISGEDGSGWEEVYWRIVRPGTSDIGDLHADKWFWDLGHGKIKQGLRRIKLWIAVNTVPEKSGLRVLPNSHLKKDWQYHGLQDHTGVTKPKFDEKIETLNVLNVSTSSGDFILFNDELIHAGMPNISTTTRCSLEATLLIKN